MELGDLATSWDFPCLRRVEFAGIRALSGFDASCRIIVVSNDILWNSILVAFTQVTSDNS